ncbi:MAG TPA: glycosyltransferase family 2 protein [Nitrospiraceae bacterium]|jgi:glycosyltransferase involved in cell wall biosynthesis|nr:glycosyltransferase family 2 protein [Nitrospiraceae bacterium]
MKISIITAVFNAAGTVEETLLSVAQQTHPEVEHVVVDGASNDATLEIIARHRDKLTRVVSEPDHGVYDAMNKGIKRASGDVIGFLNADDLYASKDILSRVVDIMERENLDALFGDVEFFRPKDPTRTVRRYRSARFSPDQIALGWMPAHPALFLRRRVYERYGLFRTDYRIAGDFEYCARIFHSNTLVYRSLPETLVRMRIGGISTSGWRNTLLLNREVLRACRENGIDTNILKIFSKYPAKLLEFLVK